MPFEKGNNLGTGRPKGKPNKTTQEVREMFQCLLEDNLNQLQNDIQALEPKDRVKTLMDLAKFVIPTLKSTELKAERDKNFKGIDISMWVKDD